MAEAYRIRGYNYLRKFDFASALPDWDRCIELGLANAPAYLNRANAREGLSDFAGAIVDETKAIELDPKLIHAYMTRAISRRSYGDYVGAIADYNKVLESDPSDRNMVIGRAWTKFFMHDYDGALQDSTLFTKLNGGTADGEGPYIVILSYLSLRKSGKKSEAGTFLDTALKTTKTGEWPTQLLQLLAGRVTADDLLKQATDDGRRTEVHSLAGEMFVLAGDTKNAAVHFQWNKENGNRTRILFQLSRLEYALL
jgi:lipoprotein NlpI